jgi:hypothetical protein
MKASHLPALYRLCAALVALVVVFLRWWAAYGLGPRLYTCPPGVPGGHVADQVPLPAIPCPLRGHWRYWHLVLGGIQDLVAMSFVSIGVMLAVGGEAMWSSALPKERNHLD